MHLCYGSVNNPWHHTLFRVLLYHNLALFFQLSPDIDRSRHKTEPAIWVPSSLVKIVVGRVRGRENQGSTPPAHNYAVLVSQTSRTSVIC
jgi:hypothetical protein